MHPIHTIIVYASYDEVQAMMQNNLVYMLEGMCIKVMLVMLVDCQDVCQL
jgi:hypothetical protein